MPVISRYFVRELKKRLTQRSPFIQVVLGPRQVGKTTGVRSLSHDFENFSYATADEPTPKSVEWIRSEWHKARLKGGILVIDEVQKISGWSEVVKLLFDEERRRENPLSVVLLGSASWHVQKGLGESLVGRFEILPAFHWSFRECREAFSWDLDTYLLYGGYPAPAALISEPERWQAFIRDSILEPTISRDITLLRSISKPALFRQTLQLALSYPAQELSYNKILGQLQESGNATTIKGYLELLEAAFLVKSVTKYSTRALTVKTSSPKLIPLCPALIHASGSHSRLMVDSEWRGRVFESAIGAVLVNTFPEVWYWRERNMEVDYVIRIGNEIFAIEIKSGRKKSSTGLSQFRTAFPKAGALTLDSETGEMLLGTEDPKKLFLALAGA